MISPAMVPGTGASAALVEGFAATHADPVAVDYLKAVKESSLVSEIANRQLAFEWVAVQVLYDDPAKTLDTSDRRDVLLFPELMRQLGKPEESFDIVSPYFVPGDEGTAMLAEMARRGVKIRVLTNSLASSDESVVHAGYLKRQIALIKGGQRAVPEMDGIVTSLDDQDMADLAAYFSSQATSAVSHLPR